MGTYSLIILGNGFDVALGIPTRYSQFYANSQELREMAAHGNHLCQHVLDHIRNELWSDLESGLYHYSLGLTQRYGEGNQTEATRFEREFNELRTALFNYLNEVSGTFVDVSTEAAVLGLNIEWHALEPQYLTFNYSINTANTASMNDRYILNADDSLNELRFIYQHGSIYNMQENANRNPNEIVVGIDRYTQEVEPAHSFLYKDQQQLHNLESTFNFIREKRLYVVYGCSVGDSDATYFREVFNHEQQGKTFLIYGYGPNAIETIKANIERICGIKIKELEEKNHVDFLDVQKVEETRMRTREIIQAYLRSLG